MRRKPDIEKLLAVGDGHEMEAFVAESGNNNMNKENLLRFAEKFGFNALLVVILLYGIWTLGSRVVDSHVNFLDTSQETMRGQTKTLDKLADSQAEQAVILKGNQEVLREIRDSGLERSKQLSEIDKKLERALPKP